MAKEFARPTTGVKTPEAVNLFGDEPPPSSSFRDFPDPPPVARYGAAPYDHAYVMLTSDGEDSHVAKWQITRRIIKGRWEPYGYWAGRNAGGKAIGFEPLGWKELVE
jgi:hypothetical protein